MQKHSKEAENQINNATEEQKENLIRMAHDINYICENKPATFIQALQLVWFAHCYLHLKPYTDLWLYDVKLLDSENHLKYTGVSNELILKNLRILNNLKANIILRCPIIPDINLNSEHFSGIANLSEELENVTEIHFEPYNPLGISKAMQLGEKQNYENVNFLSKEELLPFIKKQKFRANLKIDIMLT